MHTCTQACTCTQVPILLIYTHIWLILHFSLQATHKGCSVNICQMTENIYVWCLQDCHDPLEEPQNGSRGMWLWVSSLGILKELSHRWKQEPVGSIFRIHERGGLDHRDWGSRILSKGGSLYSLPIFVLPNNKHDFFFFAGGRVGGMGISFADF